MMAEDQLISIEQLLEEYNARCNPEDQMTERTIRYYVVEGLLPKPERRGQRAFYTGGHLDRLLLIKRLKDDEFQSLGQIKAMLDHLDDDAVRARLSAAAKPADRERARQLIARLIQESAGGTVTPPIGQPPPSSISPVPREERWRHIELADGLVLLVRQPAPNKTENIVRKLIETARSARGLNAKE
jgi:DNA-binding transcriptional MerR regulator